MDKIRQNIRLSRCDGPPPSSSVGALRRRHPPARPLEFVGKTNASLNCIASRKHFWVGFTRSSVPDRFLPVGRAPPNHPRHEAQRDLPGHETCCQPRARAEISDVRHWPLRPSEPAAARRASPLRRWRGSYRFRTHTARARHQAPRLKAATSAPHARRPASPSTAEGSAPPSRLRPHALPVRRC
ncbi:hypothetical protein OKW20_001610 [Ensifer sp. LBL]